MWPDERQVELANARHELHVTCTDGITTTAVYKLDGKVEKTAKAVCCPSDTFNFNVGAELAIKRVLGVEDRPAQPAQPAQPKRPKYYSGKVVCVWASPEGLYFTTGGVYEFKEGYVKSNGSVCYNSGDPAKTKAQALNRAFVKFIEYKGEANGTT